MASKTQTFGRVGDYEIIRALKEGAVEADGLELVVLTGHGPRERHWRMARNQEFDVCEFNVGAYFMSRDHGEPLAAIPVFSASSLSPRLCLRQRQFRYQDAERFDRQKSRRHQFSAGGQYLAARHFRRALRRAAQRNHLGGRPQRRCAVRCRRRD